ncbi:MAG: Extracellular solute-binding protein family 5 [Parcubacteria group bacterium GW2011_GWA2_40_8]|nr:MAG: Extracellular solute-binding protein family 5 [Parcubacteria group bacterium GW2011_GWA2_40_8]
MVKTKKNTQKKGDTTMKGRMRLLCFLTVVTIVGAACGSTTPNNVPQQGHTPGVLRTPGPDPLTLDPALVTDAGSHLYVSNIFDGLLTMVPSDQDVEFTLPDGTKTKVKGLAIAPDIAVAIPDPISNPDGTITYIFELRQDIFFHLGRQVNAQDVKYSLERATAPETLSTAAELYLSDIVGVRDKLRGRTRTVEGVKVIDDFTISITINGPTVDFLWKLTYPTAMVVDREQIESNPRTWTRLPNGTGPFKLEIYQQGRQLVLVGNQDYHLGAPKLTRIEFNLSGGSILTAYENGETDVSGVGIADVDRVRDPNDPLSREVVEAPSLSTSYIGFNMSKPPFDDILVRQAMTQAIDIDTIARVVLKDMIAPAHSIVPPGMLGYTPIQSKLTYDAQKARDLLAKSKYAGNMPTIVLTVSGQGATAGPVIEAMIEMWRKELSLNVKIEQVESTAFFDNLKRGKYQMFSLGWVADYPDPADFLDLKFHSANSVANNETQYSNAEVDALLDRARVESDPQTRAQLYQQAETIILNEAPWLPFLHGKTLLVVKPYVKGYVPSLLGEPFYRFIEVN